MQPQCAAHEAQHPQRGAHKRVACDGSTATDSASHATVSAATLVRAHRSASLPRFSRILKCSQHVLNELHTAAAPSLDAHTLREAHQPASHTMAQPQLTAFLHATVSAATHSLLRAHRCLPRSNRVHSCSQHAYPELHSAAAQSLYALNPSEALTSVACNGSIYCN